MLATPEHIKQEIDQLNDEQLRKVALFIESLKAEKSRFRQRDWQPLWDSLDKFSDDFMETREQPPLEARESLE